MRRLIVFTALACIFLYAQEFEEVELADLGIDEFPGSPTFIDMNNDGYIDFWAGMIYLNDGTGHFTKIKESEWAGGRVVCWGDYNNDGYADALTVKIVWIDTFPRKDTCFFILYESQGPPYYSLEDVSEQVGLGYPILDKQPNDPAWLDYDSDGLLDFFYSGYEFVPYNSEDDYPYWSGQPDYLFHNTGSGFEEVSDAAGIREGGTDTLCARGVSVADYDNDGDMDIFVSVYRLQPNILWRNEGNSTFTNVAEEAGVIGIFKDNYYGHNIGAAWGDYNNDGYLDLFTPITHHSGYPGDYTGHLWANNGPADWDFTDHFASSGMSNSEIGSAPLWVDYDNDGDLDLYWLNLYGSPNKQGWLYRNDGENQFTDVTIEVGIRTWGSKSYVLWADIDHDGDMDLYAPYTDFQGNPHRIMFINTAERGHWLELDFEGRESNRSAIGARVWAYAGDLMVMREVAPSNGNGYGSMFIARQHLGLGDNEMVDSLIIRWPLGRIDRIRNLTADRVIGMVEGPPSAPERLTYSWAGGDNYHFNWTPSPERDLAGYRLWQRYTSADPWGLLVDEIPAESTRYAVMMEPPVAQVSITAYDFCEEDNESEHSALAVSIEEVQSVPLDPNLEVGSFARIIPCRFTLPVAADVRLEIYDPSGRRVRVLASARFAPGVHELHWSGTDDEDNRCASGLYFVRLLVHGEESITRKLILL